MEFILVFVIVVVVLFMVFSNDTERFRKNEVLYKLFNEGKISREILIGYLNKNISKSSLLTEMISKGEIDAETYRRFSK